MHNVAGIDETQADAAADWRSDPGIRELQLGVVNLALVRRDGAVKLPNQCSLSVELLLRDHAFFEEEFVALKIDLGIFALGLVLGELPQGLLQLDLKGTRINLREEIAFVDELAFLERDTEELAVDAAANGYGVEGGDGAKAIEIHGQVATLGGGNNDGHNHVARAESSPGLAGCRRSSGIGRPAGVFGTAIVPATKSDNAKCEIPEPPAAPGGYRCRGAAGARLGKVYGLALAHPYTPIRKNNCPRDSATESRAIASRRRGAAASGTCSLPEIIVYD